MTKYYYAGAERIAMRSGTGSGTAGLVWIVGDHLGSTAFTVNAATGLKQSERRYKPWGELRYSEGETGTKYGFTGQMAEVDKLYDYGARFYDSSLNRFLSPDTDVPESQDGKGFDRYAYVANNPIVYQDPSGHCWGVASGIRGVPSYDTTCNNLDMALSIVQHPEASFAQKAGAGAYIAGEAIAHGALAAGAALLGCAAIGPSCSKVVEGALGIGAGASADGDPTNEVQAVSSAVQAVEQTQIIPKLTQSKLEHIVYRHWNTSGFPNTSHFGADIGLKQLTDIIGKSAGDISLWAQQGDRFVRNINIGKVIGTDPSGQATRWLRVVVDAAGEVITAYPIPEPPLLEIY